MFISNSRREFSVVLLSFFVLVLLSSCGIFKKSTEHPEEGPEDFEQFYLRFHNDPGFQMERIAFPLEGKFVDWEGERVWTRENWPVMKVPIWDINDPDYRTEYRQSDTQFYQRVWLDNSGFVSEYRFELIDGLWKLVYAMEQNL